MSKRLVLLRREIVLVELVALDSSLDEFIARRMSDKTFCPDSTITEFVGDGNFDFAIRVLPIPIVECFELIRFICAHVGDFDADRTIVGNGGMPRPLLQ